MGRSKKKPDYDPEQIQGEMIAIVKELYLGNSATEASVTSDAASHMDTDDNGISVSSGMPLRVIAEEMGISVSKVVKLLITGGIYTSDKAQKIVELYDSGMKISDIQSKLGVSRATVHSYLPYKKGIYNTKETSVNADRIRIFRERAERIENLCEHPSEDGLWETVKLFQQYPFYTASGLPFSYELKIGKNCRPNKELIVNRRKESKTLAWSSVKLVFSHAMEMRGQAITRPKALGDIRGISYIYPMLYRFGIIDVPEKTAEKMRLKGGKSTGSSGS